MIEVADANAAYFYHYDALGSVVALSDADGDTVQVYEYDVYGQVAASDPNHPNRFLFTGREFDAETGLYYYRARYYNSTIGRFLQTDPIGYADGMNPYWYCANNPWNRTDAYGMRSDYEEVYGGYSDCCNPSYAAAHPGACGSADGCDPCGSAAPDPCTVWVCSCQCEDPCSPIKLHSDPYNGASACAAYCYVLEPGAVAPAEGVVVRGLWESIKILALGLCGVGSRSKVAAIPPKPPDKCREEYGTYFDKTLGKYVTGLHHHMFWQNWDGKVWRTNPDGNHYPGPCPPGTTKIPSLPRRERRKG
jgi:RHS repeat-associated protein